MKAISLVPAAAFALFALTAHADEMEFESGAEVHEQIDVLRAENDDLRLRLEALESQMGIDGWHADACETCGSCCDCGQGCCDSCCCTPCGRLVAGASIYFLKPYWQNNPAFATRLVRNFGFQALTEQVDFDWDHEPAWDVWLGYVGCGGFGMRSRYWEFHHAAQPIAGVAPELLGGGDDIRLHIPHPLGVDIATFSSAVGSPAPFVISSSLELGVWDFELTQLLEWCGWEWEFAGGLRYGRARQTYVARFPPPPGGNAVRIIQGTHVFHGLGPTLSLEGRRVVGCTGLVFYGKVRGSVLVGETDELASSQLILATGVPVIDLSASASHRGTISIAELEVGAEYSRCFGAVRAFVEVGLVGQTWFGAGNASNNGPIAASQGAGGGATIFRPDSGQDLSLLGGRLAAGIDY